MSTSLRRNRQYTCVLSCLSHVQLFVTPWTVTHQAPLTMGFSRQEYWSGLSCFPSRDLPDPGIKPKSLTSPALAGQFFTRSAIWEAQWKICLILDLKLATDCGFPRITQMWAYMRMSSWAGKGEAHTMPISFIIHNTSVSYPLSQRSRKNQ